MTTFDLTEALQQLQQRLSTSPFLSLRQKVAVNLAGDTIVISGQLLLAAEQQQVIRLAADVGIPTQSLDNQLAVAGYRGFRK